jgi:hypothetical protein
MGIKRRKREEIAAKLHQIEVLELRSAISLDRSRRLQDRPAPRQVNTTCKP